MSIVILPLLITLAVPASAKAPATLLPAEREFKYDVLSKPNKDAIAEYRRVYRERNEREVAHLTPEQQNIILGALERAGDLGYNSELEKANRVLANMADQFPQESMLRWHVAATYFLIGRVHKDEEKQAEIYKRGIAHANKCFEFAPDTPDCWLGYAALLGSLSLAEGILDTISAMEEVNTSLHKAFDLSQKDPYPWGRGVSTRSTSPPEGSPSSTGSYPIGGSLAFSRASKATKLNPGSTPKSCQFTTSAAPTS